MAYKLCLVQEACIHYKSGSNRPNNHDVRNKYACSRYVKGCNHAIYYETQIMGLIIACKIKRRGK